MCFHVFVMFMCLSSSFRNFINFPLVFLSTHVINVFRFVFITILYFILFFLHLIIQYNIMALVLTEDIIRTRVSLLHNNLGKSLYLNMMILNIIISIIISIFIYEIFHFQSFFFLHFFILDINFYYFHETI